MFYMDLLMEFNIFLFLKYKYAIKKYYLASSLGLNPHPTRRTMCYKCKLDLCLSILCF